MTDDKDWLSNGLPTFSGGKGRTQARKMIDCMGGPSGFKTSYQTNADGSITTVQLKGNMPPQVTTTVVAQGEIEIKGLVDDHFIEGVEFLPGKEAGDVCGETYALTSYKLGGKVRKNALITGQNHWFQNEELGPDSWVYVDASKNCWLVTRTDIAGDLTTITLEFRAITNTSEIPPARPLVQTLTVVGSGSLDPDEDYPGHAYAQVEDIYTNGGKVLLVNASTPYSFPSDAPEILDRPFEEGEYVYEKGRYVYLASELALSGIPPLASGTLTTVRTTAQCRGTFTHPSGNSAHGWKEWTGLVVGMRYTNAGIVEAVTQDVRADWIETITATEVDTWTELVYSRLTSTWVNVTWPIEKQWFDHRIKTKVTQEGVEVSLTSSSLSDVPYSLVTGVGTAPGYEESWPAENAHPPAETTLAAVGVAGIAEWPGGTYDGLDLLSTFTMYFFLGDLVHYDFNMYRPVWSAETYSGRPNTTTDFSEQGYIFNRATLGIIGQKYSNRVFGLQLVSIGSSSASTAMSTAGLSISYPACMGSGVYNTDELAQLPQFVTPYVSTASRPLNTPSGNQYPTKGNVYAAPTAGTSRVLSPKLVVSPDNVAYVHYYK